MENQVEVEVEGEGEFEFDCLKMRQNLLRDDAFNANSPTRNYNEFMKCFRNVAKHPKKATLNVPHLPTPEEVSKTMLPFADLQTDPDSDTEQPTLTPSVRRGRGGARAVRGKNPVIMRTFRSHFLASLTFEGKTIFILHKRSDVYLLAVRDAEGDWWEFSKKGGTLFTGTKPLGFSESYTDMGVGTSDSGVSFGYFQLQQAFYVFADPKSYTFDDRKSASQIMIALFSEGGRLVLLSNKFALTLTDISSIVELSGTVRDLMRKWETISGFIVNNSGPQDSVKKISDAFKTLNPDLVKALEEGGMVRVNDAPMAYGLLHSSIDGGTSKSTLSSSSSGDGKKGKSKR